MSEEMQHIYNEFRAIGKYLTPLFYVTPCNEAGQKKLFLAGEIDEPIFEYHQPKYDVEGTDTRIRAIDIPDGSEYRALRLKKKDMLAKNAMILHAGERDIVLENSIQLFGKPDDDLVLYAKSILEEIPATEAPKIIPASEIKKALEAAFVRYGLSNEWRVEYSNKYATTIYNMQKKITVCENRLFAEIDANRLAVHEIGVHALRSANNALQSQKIIETNLYRDYLPTEEGLASLAEEITGTSSPEQMRMYAGRVVALSCMLEGLTFRGTFRQLQQHKFSDEQAWTLSVRVHRGGGLTRDVTYLKGYRMMKDYYENGGDLRPLYVGKVSLAHIDLIKEMLADGRLVYPKYLPYFLEEKYNETALV